MQVYGVTASLADIGELLYRGGGESRAPLSQNLLQTDKV